jgi:hypothetical protein
MAETIKKEWLQMCPAHLAKPYAQKIVRYGIGKKPSWK